jgi:hypothetical protein
MRFVDRMTHADYQDRGFDELPLNGHLLTVSTGEPSTDATGLTLEGSPRMSKSWQCVGGCWVTSIGPR